jgi:hypothetical protein
MTDKFYETITVPFESKEGDITLTYATGRDATFDDMALDFYVDGVKTTSPIKGVKAIMEHLVGIADLAPSAAKMLELMTGCWPGLRNYLPKEEA